MAAETIESPNRCPRWMKVALAVSLALNLLIVGMVGGAVLGHSKRSERADAAVDGGYGPYLRALSRADRRAMRAEFEAKSGALRGSREQMRAGFVELLVAMRADPFDPTAVAAIIRDQSDRFSARQTLGQQLLLGRITSMTADQRAEFAGRLEEILARGPVRERQPR